MLNNELISVRVTLNLTQGELDRIIKLTKARGVSLDDYLEIVVKALIKTEVEDETAQ